MPASNCDSSRPYTVAYFNHPLPVVGQWTWDGVSVPPNCNGPITSLHVVNQSPTDTYRALLPNARRGQGFVDMPPGTDQTVTGGQLRTAGLDTIQDLAAVNLVKL
jgi:hypothetical protein